MTDGIHEREGDQVPFMLLVAVRLHSFIRRIYFDFVFFIRKWKLFSISYLLTYNPYYVKIFIYFYLFVDLDHSVISYDTRKEPFIFFPCYYNHHHHHYCCVNHCLHCCCSKIISGENVIQL